MSGFSLETIDLIISELNYLLFECPVIKISILFGLWLCI